MWKICGKVVNKSSLNKRSAYLFLYNFFNIYAVNLVYIYNNQVDMDAVYAIYLK